MKKGFRFAKLELLNWGTFDKKVWNFTVEGENSFLTGEVGTGKSTIVDAITSLLIQPSKISFNKAAGAKARERNLKSYVLGYYGAERNEKTGQIKPLSIRQGDGISVILGVFVNEETSQKITLGQVLWLNKTTNQIDYFYLNKEDEITIAQTFSNFTSIKNLKKQLKDSRVNTYDGYVPYGNWLKRKFNFVSDQALDLFNQTVSLKNIDNLTDFIRNHTLSKSEEIDKIIEHISQHYEDLDLSYKKVKKAKDMLNSLQPIVKKGKDFEIIKNKIYQTEVLGKNLTLSFLLKRQALLTQQEVNLIKEQESIDKLLHTLSEKEQKLTSEIEFIKLDIQKNGGERIETLKIKIKELEKTKAKRQQLKEVFVKLINKTIASIEEIISLSKESTIKEAELSKNNKTISLFDNINSNKETLNKLIVALENKKEILSSELINFTKSKLGKEVEIIVKNSEEINQLLTSLEEILNQENALINLEINKLNKNISDLTKEINILKSQTNNIHFQRVQIRKELCEALGLTKEQLPFVGELLKVKDNEQEWEGAIEKLLNGFAQSLIVEEKLYSKVSKWINENNLKGKFVYYKINEWELKRAYRNDDYDEDYRKEKVFSKLSINPKTQSNHYNWLKYQLETNYNYICCNSIYDFEKENKAITKQGLIKNRNGKHEKDDRKSILDRSNYVLGWDNSDKINLLEEKLNELKQYSKLLKDYFDTKGQISTSLKELNYCVIKVEQYNNSEDLNIDIIEQELNEVNKELDNLLNSQNILNELQNSLNEKIQELASVKTQHQEKLIELGGINKDLSSMTNKFDKVKQKFINLFEDLEEEINNLFFYDIKNSAKVEVLKKQIQSKENLSVDLMEEFIWILLENCFKFDKENLIDLFSLKNSNNEEVNFSKKEAFKTFVNALDLDNFNEFSDEQLKLFVWQIKNEVSLKEIQNMISSQTKKENDLNKLLQNFWQFLIEEIKLVEKAMTQNMIAFNSSYPLETKDFDAHIDSLQEYQNLYRKIEEDDLPKHENYFKEQLNKNAIQEIANFSAQFHKEINQMENKIREINESLKEIDFEEDKYIQLELRKTLDQDVKNFQYDLKDCTENIFNQSTADENIYTEDQFLKVQKIIERLKGRENKVELDEKWREKVTDVRNWFTFETIKFSRSNYENNGEKEYIDSNGKSGGQKEKLAYTILAASLAYQFGVSKKLQNQNKSFRFVLIDEAFSKSSNNSAKYALSLFDKLGLQLMIITPLSKTDVIEPFVKRVGLIKNDKGNDSMLLNLTIEEYSSLIRQ